MLLWGRLLKFYELCSETWTPDPLYMNARMTWPVGSSREGTGLGGRRGGGRVCVGLGVMGWGGGLGLRARPGRCR